MYWHKLPQGLDSWPLQLAQSRFSKDFHGDFERWQAALHRLPVLQNQQVIYGDTVTVTGATDADELETALRQLHPWRKGPFCIAGLHIDTEWRSDWKWRRLAPALPQLTGQRILDIGCGNGYFGWRLLEQGADEVIGVDPTLLFCMQHQAVLHYTQDFRNWVLPLKAEELPAEALFDTVLSMGVIYHRRDPLTHSQHLAALAKPGGTVVLESLVVVGDPPLYPQQRYARMRNVWCVPTVALMHKWLAEAGLTEITTVDVSPTTTAEQRSTAWMHFESLDRALDPDNPDRTIEGHPAPVRAIVTARKPAA